MAQVPEEQRGGAHCSVRQWPFSESVGWRVGSLEEKLERDPLGESLGREVEDI